MVPHDRPHRRRPRARLRRVPGHARRDAGRRFSPRRQPSRPFRSPSRARRRRSRGVVRARSGAPGPVPAGRGGGSSPWLSRPVLRPVDFDPFAPASARAALSHRAAGGDVDCRRHEPRGQLLVQPVLRLHVPGAVADRVLARRARSGGCSARRVARRHRAGRRRPDAAAALLRRDAVHRHVEPRFRRARA